MATIPAVPQKQPLPLNPFDEQDQPDLHDAYDQCLASEREAGSEQELMYARCLGYFLIEAPVAHGQHTVAKDILLCNGDKRAMDHLAQLYINHIILLFRQNKGKTPAPSYHPSQPSFDDNSLFYSATIEPAPQNHRAAKLAALERDGYNCMVTGLHDKGKYIQLTPADRAARGWNRLSMKTNFCHIFPPSTNWELELNEPNHPKTTCAANVWNLIYAFGGIQVLDELNGDSIHRLSNGLTLAIHVHDQFDDLRLWLEEVPNGPPNTYFLRSMEEIVEAPTTPITFTSSSPKLELPDPRYLKLHAAVCRVAHMSGAAEHLDKYDRDMELISVLSQDGSSNELLASRLQGLVLAF